MPVMKAVAKILFIVGIALMITLVSCRKIEQYPIEPSIEFNRFLVEIDTATGITPRAILEFSYKDGDGDIGLDPGNLNPPFNPGSKYYYNLIIHYFEKQHGQFVEVPLLWWNNDSSRFDTLTFNARIPNLTPKTGNLNISGIIQDTLFIYNPSSSFDTIRFSFYIYDRALHKSNEVTTPELVRQH